MLSRKRTRSETRTVVIARANRLAHLLPKNFSRLLLSEIAGRR